MAGNSSGAIGTKGVGLIAGLDAEGVSSYITHMLATFESAGQARGVDASADAAATAAAAAVHAKLGTSGGGSGADVAKVGLPYR